MLKINKFTVLGIIATIVLTFLAGVTGFFEFAFFINPTIGIYDYFFYLNSMVLMLGICLGILSTFAKRKRKTLFYSSILTIILGQIIMGAILGYMNPRELLGPNKEFLDMGIVNSFISLLWDNLRVSLIAILTGPTIISPYIILSTNFTSVTANIAANISFHGFESVILWLGAFHAYPELYATYLACVSGIRISLKSFKAYISIRRNGFKSTLKTIGRVMIHELRSTVPKVVILLIIAALLQALWDPFWINYWLQHIA